MFTYKDLKLVDYDESIDLTEFYTIADKKGFTNNSSKKALVDCLKNEREWAMWILFYQHRAVGSVGCHSLDISDLGKDSYRICVRTCVFTDLLPAKQLRSLGKVIEKHQNITAQLFIPKCIDWAGKNKNLYITSHETDVGTQRLVHTIYCPALEKTGVLTKTVDLMYRGHVQTFWKLNTDTFLTQLEEYSKLFY